MKKDCFKKKRDDEERKRNEQANVGTDNNNEEMVLMAFDYPWCCETHKHTKKDCGKEQNNEEEQEMTTKEEKQTIDENDQEKEGPTNKWFTIGRESNYNCFYMGMQKYEFHLIPNPVGTMPESPRKNWTFGNYYDKDIGWQDDEEKYQKELTEWKLTNMRKIKHLTHNQLQKWKDEYKQNVQRQ